LRNLWLATCGIIWNKTRRITQKEKHNTLLFHFLLIFFSGVTSSVFIKFVLVLSLSFAHIRISKDSLHDASSYLGYFLTYSIWQVQFLVLVRNLVRCCEQLQSLMAYKSLSMTLQVLHKFSLIETINLTLESIEELKSLYATYPLWQNQKSQMH